MTDASSQLSESATYCKPNDPKRPSLVGLPDASTSQVCPADGSATTEVDDAYPDGWYVRIMFDELLDPRVEELSEILDDDGAGTGTFEGSIAGTHPVTLECQSVVTGQMVNVSYDGYYSPSGNSVTWPLGPSLVIKPNDPTLIATGKECQVTLSNLITDKDGTEVPMDQRGPYKFKVAEISTLFTDPTDSLDETMPTEVDSLAPFNDNFYWQFNTDVQVSSFCADTDFGGTFANGFLDSEQGFGSCDEGTENFQISPPVTAADAGGFWGYCSNANILYQEYCSTAADCTITGARCDFTYAYTYNGQAADDEIGIGYGTPLKTEQAYTFSLKQGTKLKDRCGAETVSPAPTAENGLSIRFKTAKIGVNGITIADGETASMSKKPNIQFNAVIDQSSLDPANITLKDASGADPNGFLISQFTGGELIVGGNFQLDTAYTLTIKAGTTVKDWYGATYTFPATDTVVHWKTAPKIALTSSTADKTVFTKLVAQQTLSVAMNFNANMDVSTLTTADFTLTNKAGTDLASTVVITTGSSAAGANCSATSQSCQLRLRADFPPDDYTFTLKAGAKISDKLGNEYTQEKDLVIHFTVKPPVTPAQCL